MQENKICAIVVTFKRCEVVKQCLEKILQQTRHLDKIIVVDNDSKDGTEEMMNSCFALPQIDYINIKGDNIGPISCWCIAMKKAMEEGFGRLWLVEDDAFVEPESLERLISFIKNNNVDIVAPIGLNTIDSKQIVRYIPLVAEGSKYLNLSYIEFKNKFPEFFPYGLSAYHGTLISSDVIRDIGFPKADLFICGDDYDYLYILSKKYKCGICTQTVCHHPPDDIKYEKVFGGLMGSAAKIPNNKLYYSIRNNIYVYKKHLSKNYALKYAVKQFIKYFCFSLQKKDIKMFFITAKAITNGFFEIWNKI